MPELEKVIAGLESCRPGRTCEKCPYHDLFYKGICNQQLEADALALLKEQEPITPCIRGEDGFSYNDFTRQYGCGSCGKPIDHGDEFCRHCGQAVKWDA